MFWGDGWNTEGRRGDGVWVYQALDISFLKMQKREHRDFFFSSWKQLMGSITLLITKH